MVGFVSWTVKGDKCKKHSMRSVSVQPFGDKIFVNKHLFFFGKDRFFKAIKSREHVGNVIVFARDKVNVRVQLLNVVEPLNGAIRSGVISGIVEMVSINV